MPLPLLAGAIGKGLLGGAKTVGAATKSGAVKTFSVGKYLAKESIQGATNLAQRGAKVARQGGKKVVKGAKFFKQKVGSIRKRGGNIARRLKENAINLRESLKRGNKNQKKLRTKKQQRKRRAESIKKKREKEKQLEANKSSSDQKKTEKNLAKSSLGSFDKLFAFGGLLLGGILVNAFAGLKKKAEEFYVNNKELFDTIGGFLTKVKDSVVGLLDSFTGPESEEGAYDDFAKFGDNGKLLPAPDGGALSEFVKVIEDLKPAIEKINDATKNPIVKALEKSGFIPERSLMDRAKEFVTGTGPGQLNNYESQRQGESQESVTGQTSEGSSTGPASSGTTLNYGLVNPTPNTNILENKGGYAADTGLDIIGKVGDPIVSPVDGILEYAERGHTAQMGQDSDPTKPGIQDQLSFRIRLNKPFTFDGKKVNFVYGTHLATLDAGVANKFDIPIKAGQRLGTMGVANNVPHLHIGFVEDRAQTGFLNFKEVRRLLSGQSSNGEKKGAAGLLKGSRDERNKQMNAINQPDPDDEEVATLFIQRVNTIQYVPVPVTA